MKCDYCDQRATTLAGDTNGVLVCEDHVRLFAEREIAADLDRAERYPGYEKHKRHMLARATAHAAASADASLTMDDVDWAFARRLADALVHAMCKSDPEWDGARAKEVRSHMRTALAAVGVTGVQYEADPRDCCDRCGGAKRHRAPCEVQ